MCSHHSPLQRVDCPPKTAADFPPAERKPSIVCGNMQIQGESLAEGKPEIHV